MFNIVDAGFARLRRLARVLHPLPKPLSPFSSLPAEIHLNILSFLPASSQISLGLTCKRLWTLLPPRIAHRNTFRLRTSEGFCHFLRLACRNGPFATNMKSYIFGMSGLSHRPDGTGVWKAGPLWCGTHYHIHHHVQDLILRRHQLSPRHGIALSVLKHDCIHQCPQTGVRRSTIIIPHIVRNRLFLELRFDISFNLRSDLEYQKRTFYGIPCSHQDLEFRREYVSYLELLARGRDVWGDYGSTGQVAHNETLRMLCNGFSHPHDLLREEPHVHYDNRRV